MNIQNNLAKPNQTIKPNQAFMTNQAFFPNQLGKLVLAALFSAALTACGGGEGGESTNSPVPATTPPAPATPSDNNTSSDASNEQTEAEAANEAADTTAELVSTPDFDFAGSFELDVTIAAAPAGSTQYYVNICSDFEQIEAKEGAPASWQVNYDSCLLRTFITGQAQVFTLSLSEAQSELIAQVWPMENGAIPTDLFWQKQSQSSEWLITL
ncbi:hypothetical protein [Thalassotalea euphylliae]|uniref:Uncharacterized protein n=1 Tax=Thalassotalea euphylliae TaxID=1655234 RepID=A0A3E0UIY3_9GAMM|nr:hypothetical protein [Thalassotalea euphylliae]REL36544.1 hypothetical protein DXX92_15135 [Thalassotalea euphylliae]